MEAATRGSGKPRSGVKGAHIALIAWGVVATLASSYLMARHVLALPAPPRSSLESALAAHRAPREQGRWLLVHVLYEECTCSRRVVDHLLSSARPADVVERILWVGTDATRTAAAERQGFGVTRVTPRELAADYHIESAPLLLVVDPQGHLRYSGGYSTQKQGADLRDVPIVAALRAGLDEPSLPLFGCAVSDELRRALNPLLRLYDALHAWSRTTGSGEST